MSEPTDHELLADYARTGAEPAFGRLVARYINLVHSAARRHAGSEEPAGEITQAVFLILARKAGSLAKGGRRRHVALGGWLYETARLTAANALKAETRRQLRDHEAYMQSQENQADAAVWREIAPLLDDAMGKLGETDRNVLVLRFFEGRTNAETAAALGLAEGAVQKRVLRALEKLRASFAKQGVTHTAQAIAGTVTTNAVQVAPAGLLLKVSLLGAKGTVVTASITALAKGVLHLMAWAKAKTTVLISATVILAAGVAVLSWQEIKNPNDTSEILEKTTPQVKIVPTRFPNKSPWGTAGDKLIGYNQPISMIIATAYDLRSPYRIEFQTKTPANNYDFIANLPNGSREALQHELKLTFGLNMKLEKHDADVFLLTVKQTNALGLKPSQMTNTTAGAGRGRFFSTGQTLYGLVYYLEYYLQKPVLDRTGLTNTFDINLKWDEPNHKTNPDNLKQALLNQLGLELLPSREPIEMLVVEKAK